MAPIEIREAFELLTKCTRVLHFANVGGVPSHCLMMWKNKNHEDNCFFFFKIPLYAVFVLVLKLAMVDGLPKNKL